MSERGRLTAPTRPKSTSRSSTRRSSCRTRSSSTRLRRSCAARLPTARSSRPTATGSGSWNGQAQGTTLAPGDYTLELGATDLAGNSTPVRERWHVQLRIRYIQLASAKIEAVTGAHFVIGVSTDAKRYSWQLGSRKGHAAPPLLRL